MPFAYGLLDRASIRALRRLGIGIGLLGVLGGATEGCASLVVDTADESPSNAPGGYGGQSGASGMAGFAGKGGSGQAGGAGKAGGAGAVSYEPKGYFDLTFNSVTATVPMGPGDVEPPSQKTALRVDLPEAPAKGATWQATVTPRWGQPALFTVTAVEGGLLLKGSTTLTETTSTRRVTDVWQSFTLEMKGKALTGKVSSTGQESVYQGELGWSGALSGGGDLRPDATLPEGRAANEPGAGPEGALLPWDAVQVRFAEPLKPTEALAKLALQGEGGSVPLAWDQPKGTLDGSVSTLAGYQQGWDGVVGAAKLQLHDGFRDPALNEGQGFEKDFSVISVPPAPVGGVVWGDGHQVLWGSSASFVGETCEGKGCLAVGPFMSSSCGVSSAGAALRLPAPPVGVTKLRIRLRALLSQPATTEPGGPAGPALLTVDVARPGKGATSVEVPTPSALEADDGGSLPFASAWTTVLVQVPDGVGEVGVALRAGGFGSGKLCGETGKKNPAQAEVLVGSVGYETP